MEQTTRTPTSSPSDALVTSWTLSLHGLRPQSVRLYTNEVRRFARWLADHQRPLSAPGDLAAVDRADIEAWISDMRAHQLTTATIRSRWVALRNLYKWMVDEEEIDDNPLAKVKVARPLSPPPAVVDDDALRLLLKACQGRDFLARRDTALIRMFVSTGLRAGEMARLDVADVDLRSRIVRVVDGKGGKPRIARFDPETAAAVDRYLRVRARHRHAPAHGLWLGPTGPIGPKAFGRLLSRRGAQAGIGHIHPHQLRHTWAHRWLAAGGVEGDLMRLGGWSNSDVMRRYGSGLAVDRALAAYDVVNPMGEL